MVASQLIGHNNAQGLDLICPSCGGSGRLRLADQRYRTCLDCLGRGRLNAIASASRPLSSTQQLRKSASSSFAR